MAAAAALLLAGCGPTAREPDELALVQVLGLDGAGPVELTAVCGGANDKNESRGACAGENFCQALALLPWSGEQELSLTSVAYLVIGPDADLEGALLDVLEDEELGASATIWLAQEGASAALARCVDPASDLELLAHRGVGAPTVVQALAALCTDGWVDLPQVGVEGDRLVWQGETRWEERA